jgi:AcrR family transcriptional regulator
MAAAATLDSLREKERESRRELILSCARKLFAEKDFRSVTARQIAREAGVSAGTLYRYYQNLDELFLDVFFAGAREITESLDAENRRRGGCSLRKFCEIYITTLNENISFYQMMGHFMLGGKLSPEATKKLNPIMRDLMDRIEGIVRGAKVRQDARLVSHALFSALNGVMISYAQYPGRSLEEIRTHTLRLAGVVARCFQPKA